MSILPNMILPESVESIGYRVFSHNKTLANINLIGRNGIYVESNDHFRITRYYSCVEKPNKQ